MNLMRDLDHTDALAPSAAEERPASPFAQPPPASEAVFAALGQEDAAPPVCVTCGQENDPDARFCKQCGSRLA
jgi:ribosomal protein L40E